MIWLATLLANGGGAALQNDLACWDEQVSGQQVVHVFRGYRSCFGSDLSAPREYEGIWIDEFEGSRFYPGVRSLSRVGDYASALVFEMDDHTVAPPHFRSTWSHGIYRLRIVGRMVIFDDLPVPEGSIRIGLSRGVMVVDRVISAELVGSTRSRSFRERHGRGRY